MYLSAVDGNNSNSQANFKAKMYQRTIDLVAQEAKNAGKSSELSDVMGNIRKYGSCDTMIDYISQLNSLFVRNHKFPKRAIRLEGNNVVEQALGINEAVILKAEKDLAEGKGITLYH